MSEHKKVSLLTLTCREASRLTSESLDRELTRRERWALKLHTLICSACRKLIAQLNTLRSAMEEMPTNWREQWSDESLRLSAERRAAIKRLLSEASEGESSS